MGNSPMKISKHIKRKKIKIIRAKQNSHAITSKGVKKKDLKSFS